MYDNEPTDYKSYSSCTLPGPVVPGDLTPGTAKVGVRERANTHADGALCRPYRTLPGIPLLHLPGMS